MFIRKLDAIDSTNTYLKQISASGDSENWMVVTAEYQTLGRGQQNSLWHSEKGKNLLFSVLINDLDLPAKDQFGISCAVSLAIHSALSAYGLPGLRVKWPNDIMSGSGKLGGILIENSVLGSRIGQSIVGIGLNVNQLEFPEQLGMAVSMRSLVDGEVDRQELLFAILSRMQEQFTRLKLGEWEQIKRDYESLLYRAFELHKFRDVMGAHFIGRITGITEEGLLLVEREDGSLSPFRFKEIAYV